MNKISIYFTSALVMSMCYSVVPASAYSVMLESEEYFESVGPSYENSMVPAHQEKPSLFQETVIPSEDIANVVNPERSTVYVDISDQITPALDLIFGGIGWRKSTDQQAGKILRIQGQYEDESGFGITFSYNVDMTSFLNIASFNDDLTAPSGEDILVSHEDVHIALSEKDLTPLSEEDILVSREDVHIALSEKDLTPLSEEDILVSREDVHIAPSEKDLTPLSEEDILVSREDVHIAPSDDDMFSVFSDVPAEMQNLTDFFSKQD